MNNSKLKRRREKMFRKNPHCPLCGVLMELPPDGKPPKMQPDHWATIDHKYSRNDPRRNEPNLNKENRWFLCCKKCNNHRNDIEQDSIPVEVRRERAAQNHGMQRVIRISGNGAINYRYVKQNA